MLCSDCKKSIPKWKISLHTSKMLCLSCKHARSRKLQVSSGLRPTAERSWREHLEEKEQEILKAEQEKRDKEKDALLSWLKH